MDFKETKEMIDATIYENGNGEITAQNVNLAMQGIVDAAEEAVDEVKNDVSALGERVTVIEENGVGGGEGSGALRVWLNEENTPEQVEENAATRNSLLENPYQPLVMGMTLEEGYHTSECVPVYVQNGEVMFSMTMQEFDEEGYITGQMFFKFKINEDGTLEPVV